MYVQVSVRDKLVVSPNTGRLQSIVWCYVDRLMVCWSVPHGPVHAELIVSNQTTVLEQC